MSTRQRPDRGIRRQYHPPKRMFHVLSVTFITIGVLILVAISPLALRSLADMHQLDWARLSNIGQTYDAVSAFLVAIGLGGVVVTVILQVRELRYNRMSTDRNHHFELIKMAMDDPTYMKVLRPKRDFDSFRQSAYANLMIRHWQVIWEFGDLSETELRETIASDLFSSPAGRSNWERFVGGRLRDATSKRQREFVDILNDEFKGTIDNPYPHHGTQAQVTQDSRQLALPFIGAGLVLIAALFAVIRRAIRKQ